MPDSSPDPVAQAPASGAAGRSGPRLRAYSVTDVGRSRSENQDFCGEFTDRGGQRLLIVADGMGGHRGGATASRLCVETVGQVFVEDPAPLEERMRRGIGRANERLLEVAERDPTLRGMGTTAVAMAFPASGDALVGWVGDSRAYRLRRGRLEPLTEDHSLINEWVRTGVISAEDAETHPRRHELLRSVGSQRQVEMELARLEVAAGDRFLLCSDGLSGYVPHETIEAVASSEPADRAAQTLVRKANEAGGLDNVTVQVIEIVSSEVGTPAPGHAQAAENVARETTGRSWHRPATFGLLLLLLLALALLLAFSG